nr:hypothetical protein [Tanacetum cinerariifolium]
MLVEKDYPLRKGLAIGMISYKLQVENYSKMANDLILKIYKIASSPRQQVIEFPLPEEVPTTSEESSHCQKKREATAVKIALLLKSKRNCQSKSDDSYANDGTLNDVRNTLDDRLKGIRMQYLPTTIWRRGDKDRAAAMIQEIEKMLKTRRIMRSLEKFVGGRLYEGDFRMLQKTI